MKRGRNQRRRQGSNPNRALDSNGPDVRIRGTANQIHDKYIALARDASSGGDRVKAESYLQHAEHYFRLIRSLQTTQPPQQQTQSDGEGEQPSIDSDDAPRDNRRQQSARRNGAADAVEDGAGAPPGADAPDADRGGDEGGEEKKPRRRRAPRRPAKRTDDSDAGGEAKESAVE